MTKIMIDCGNCIPDFMAIKNMVMSHFDTQVVKADTATEVIEILKTHSVSLVTVNRKLDIDYSDGIDAIKQIQTESSLVSVPIMLITNYEDHMKTAIAVGCVPGFGKLELQDTKTIEKLRMYLS